MIKNKYFLLPTFLLLFLFLSTRFASALEVPLPGLSNNPSLPDYVSYFFKFGIAVAGILSLISFTIGAIGLISPNIESHSEARSRMKGAVLGLILTFASFIIIQTINPTLATPTLHPIASVPGVSLSNGGSSIPAPNDNPDTSATAPGFNTLQYNCNGNGPNIIVWMYTAANYGNPKGAHVSILSCNNSLGLGNAASFKWANEDTGVYYCLGGCSGQTCSGDMSGAITSSQDNIDPEFNGTMKGVMIVNDPTNNIFYGAILHKEIGIDSAGQCTAPVTSAGCQPVNIPVSAADIFSINQTANSANSTSSGDGVTFYSEPYGWDSGAQAGQYPVQNTAINTGIQIKSNAMCFNYTNPFVDRPDSYKYKCENSSCGNNNTKGIFGGTDCSPNACETFQDCPGSIQIKGSYLVALYSQSNTAGNNSLYCETFTDDVESMMTEPFEYSTPGSQASLSSQALGSVYIIPTK